MRQSSLAGTLDVRLLQSVLMVKVNDVPAGGSRLHRFALFASVVVIGVIGAGAGMPAPAAGQPTPAGPEFAVSGATVSANPSPTVAANDRGQVVVLWLGDCGGSVGVCARSYDAAGSPLTAETLLDLQTEPLSRAPAAALSFAGKLIVVWPAFDPLQSITTITARLFTLDLHPAGGAVAVGSTGAAHQLLDRPAIANLPGGGAVVVWEEYGLDGVPFALRGQLLDAAAHPVGARFRVDAGPAAPTAPAVAADAGGRFVVAWDTYAFTASLDDVAARVFDPLGHPLGDPFVVHQQTADVQESPAVAASPGGEFLVAWLSHLSVGAGPGVYVRKVSAAGPLGPSESKVSPPTAGQDFGPAAAGGAAGFAVAWETAVGNGSAVSYRSLDLAGVAQGGAQPLASTLGLFDQRPAVAADVAGNLFVAWNRRNPDFHRQIVGRRFLASPPGVCATSPNVLCLGGGRFQVEVAWHDQHNGPSGRGTAIPGSDKTGYFWFFSDTNVELVVKILDARTVNGFFWFFYGALSDVEYTITVTDVATGERRFYDNPAGNLCGLGDTRAFPLGGPAAPLGGRRERHDGRRRRVVPLALDGRPEHARAARAPPVGAESDDRRGRHLRRRRSSPVLARRPLPGERGLARPAQRRRRRRHRRALRRPDRLLLVLQPGQRRAGGQGPRRANRQRQLLGLLRRPLRRRVHHHRHRHRVRLRQDLPQRTGRDLRPRRHLGDPRRAVGN